ncbi:hypothetical protein Goshw_014349 [Gossypium schwendimanii]|uniref:DUF4283 domain-containing protein n=1 Tax=Gossypium schwendimanii TaxID=34291 RepID=A0A7J9LFT6_GOSSC|nr:hypothetical protein [Gossypium schwendimanii]
MTESVRFKDKYINPDESRDMDLSNESALSWKNRLPGKGQLDLKKTEGIDPECDVDFEFCEGDISKSTINGIPLIEFSERVHQFLIQDMSITIVLKLLGRNIGYVAFFNRIHSLWRPVSIQLMDIENSYFLTKFSDKGDFDKITNVLTIVEKEIFQSSSYALQLLPTSPISFVPSRLSVSVIQALCLAGLVPVLFRLSA